MTSYQFIAGVDEVGRGPLAGEVYAAAVILDPQNPISGLADSKALSEKKRTILDLAIREQALSYCIAKASVAEIDEINILQATFLAMRRAVAGLDPAPDFIRVDGNRLTNFPCPAEAVVKGDSKFDEIKAASIIAKVARDTAMIELDKQYPGYDLAKHKGYPTKAHMAALAKLGPSPIHRMSFAPCQKYAVSS